MSNRRIGAVLLVTACTTMLLGWLARAPYQAPGSDLGVLRLSWRMRTSHSEKCRPRTAEELARLPVHMRTAEVCEYETVPYRLTVQIEDQQPEVQVITPAGAKGDRPVFVLHETTVFPGTYRVRIWFMRMQEEGEQAEGADADDAAIPSMHFDRRLHIEAGRVALVTLDHTARSLVVR